MHTITFLVQVPAACSLILSMILHSFQIRTQRNEMHPSAQNQIYQLFGKTFGSWFDVVDEQAQWKETKIISLFSKMCNTKSWQVDFQPCNLKRITMRTFSIFQICSSLDRFWEIGRTKKKWNGEVMVEFLFSVVRCSTRNWKKEIDFMRLL